MGICLKTENTILLSFKNQHGVDQSDEERLFKFLYTKLHKTIPINIQWQAVVESVT